jgi:RNA polymerase sigma factor (sigma-70 family)
MQAQDRIETADVASQGEDWVLECFRLHQAALVGYVQHLLGDLEAARDVVQDAFLRLCRENGASVRDYAVPWLYTVCRRRALDLLRKERRLQPLDETESKVWESREPAPDAAADTNEQAGRALRCLRRLPENQREVLVLKFQHALSYQEISRITGLSVSNVGFLIHTALKTLRRWMDAAPMPAGPSDRRSA